MTSLFQLSISNYQFTMNYQLSIINGAVLNSYKLVTVNLLKIVNCKLRIGATKRSDH